MSGVDGDADRFRQLTPEVATFIARLMALSAVDWDMLRERCSRRRSLVAGLRRSRALRALRRIRGSDQKDRALEALKSALPSVKDKQVIPADLLEALVTATLAVVVFEKLPSRHFDVLYMPFDVVIPREEVLRISRGLIGGSSQSDPRNP